MRSNSRIKNIKKRIFILRSGMCVLALLVVFRLFSLQVMDGGFYQALASGQHSFYRELFANRGDIWIRDWVDGSEYKVATNVPSYFVYAEPIHIEDPLETTIQLSRIFGFNIPQIEDDYEVEEREDRFAVLLEEVEVEEELGDDELSEEVGESEDVSDEEEVVEEMRNEEVEDDRYREFNILLARLSKENDPYEPVRRNVNEAMMDRIRALDIRGIRWMTESIRAYPETGIGGQVLGFVGFSSDGASVGRYGIEGGFEQFLAGRDGFLQSVSDPSGRWIGGSSRAFEPAVDGGDVLLTIDRTVQFIACDAIKRGVERFQADMGTVVILEPSTGRVMAMCSWPDFNPETYSRVESIDVYNNPVISHSYEPGSIFKPLVMAAGIDAGVITPNSTFVDTGEEKIDRFMIRNSDLRAHGEQTMTYVLDNSLNTGMIYVMRKLTMPVFREYMNAFDFGKRTGIELPGEVAGNFNSLNRMSEIFYATASYGQGVTVTPLQIAQAYAAIANDGLMMKPYIVEERRHPGGYVERSIPQPIRQVISRRAAMATKGMLVSSVEGPHGVNARVEGHYVAGKTGTAQVASASGGYARDHTKASFAGFGPVDNPQFAMLVMLDRPRTTQWASSSSAIIWSEIADFIMRYLEIIPQR